MVVSVHTSVSDLTLQSKIRKDVWEDTTVVEINIAYAIDARPLWDSIRLLTRIMETCRISVPASKVSFQP